MALGFSVRTVAISMVVYHLVSSYYFLAGSIEHKMIHLALAISLILLAGAAEGKKPWLNLVAMVIGILGILYLKLNLERLLENIGFPETMDLIVASTVVGIVFFTCIQAFGWILPIVALSLIAYGFGTEYIGGPILSVEEIITTVSLTFGGYDMWGSLLDISANTIFLFVLFGGMYQGLKAVRFFENLGGALGRVTRSGPAMSAVVSSALIGTTTGQTSPNVAVTGAFTIPLMKRAGYRAHVAAAIEAASSAGGQIMPPIMGAGAFVMADILGISYFEVVKMALIPALLYFCSLAIYIHLHALKGRVKIVDMDFSRRELLAYGPLFVVPLAVILGIMASGYPPMIAAFWAILILVFMSLLQKLTRPTWTMVLDGCVGGAKVGAKVAIACATLGPLIALVTKTGLALTIGASVEAFAHDNVLLGLIVMMFVVIILGLEVPTVAAYLIAAIVAVPVLVRLGLDLKATHMFAFYFGGFSALTPPVGMAAIVASKLANAKYLPTAMESVFAAAAAFLVPYVFIFEGSLLLLPGSSPESVLFAVTFTLLGLGLFQSGVIGYLFCDQKWVERVVLISAGASLLIAVATNSMFIISMALTLTLCGALVNFLRARRIPEHD
jgi:TRAP transporter 4TM/12TM fusion protein